MISFKIIERRSNTWEILILVLEILGFSGVITSAFLNNVSAFIYCIVFMFILLVVWMFLKQSGIIIKYEVVGNLCLNEKFVSYSLGSNHDEEVRLNDIVRLIINYHGYNGLFYSNGRYYGDTNQLIIETTNNKRMFTFLINNENEVFALRNLMENWYKFGLNLNESGLTGRSFLLQSGMTYKELQEAKNRLNI